MKGSIEVYLGHWFNESRLENSLEAFGAESKNLERTYPLKNINPKYVCIHVRTGRAYKKKKMIRI